MDPQVKSFLTSFGIFLATSVASWAVSVGIIPEGQQSTVANTIVAFGGYAMAAGLAWWKTRTHTQSALIAAVNAADNGVKVVAQSANASQVDVPLKGA